MAIVREWKDFSSVNVGSIKCRKLTDKGNNVLWGVEQPCIEYLPNDVGIKFNPNNGYELWSHQLYSIRGVGVRMEYDIQLVSFKTGGMLLGSMYKGSSISSTGADLIFGIELTSASTVTLKCLRNVGSFKFTTWTRTISCNTLQRHKYIIDTTQSKFMVDNTSYAFPSDHYVYFSEFVVGGGLCTDYTSGSTGTYPVQYSCPYIFYGFKGINSSGEVVHDFKPCIVTRDFSSGDMVRKGDILIVDNPSFDKQKDTESSYSGIDNNRWFYRCTNLYTKDGGTRELSSPLLKYTPSKGWRVSEPKDDSTDTGTSITYRYNDGLLQPINTSSTTKWSLSVDLKYITANSPISFGWGNPSNYTGYSYWTTDTETGKLAFKHKNSTEYLLEDVDLLQPNRYTVEWDKSNKVVSVKVGDTVYHEISTTYPGLGYELFSVGGILIKDGYFDLGEFKNCKEPFEIYRIETTYTKGTETITQILTPAWLEGPGIEKCPGFVIENDKGLNVNTFVAIPNWEGRVIEIP